MSSGVQKETLEALYDGSFRGVVENLPIDLYHSLTQYFSSSHLKYLASNSPEHFKAKYIDCSLPLTARSPAMTLGSAFHSRVLTPGSYDDEFYVMPDVDGRTTEGKLLKKKALEECGDRMVIGIKDDETALDMATSAILKFRDHLMATTCEVSFFWKCDFTGLLFRGRYDLLHAGSGTLLELKSCQDASPAGFSRQAYNLHYDLSLSHYEKGLALCGLPVSRRIFLCTENEMPYVSQAYEVGDAFVDTGHEKWLEAVGKLEKGLTQGAWPGYVDEAFEELPVINPPTWALPKVPLADESDEGF